ncbi:MAG: hypothetical protein US74_C0041G0001 [Parcubacteria group bacterium GW2011_GWA2_38_13]|nr:MAG: hypothetical protein US74_C0041G0001 [Parcubacteria group bacterium GW2011_GWA2_38_13]
MVNFIINHFFKNYFLFFFFGKLLYRNFLVLEINNIQQIKILIFSLYSWR